MTDLKADYSLGQGFRLSAHVIYHRYLTHRTRCELCRTPGIACLSGMDLYGQWRAARKAMVNH